MILVLLVLLVIVSYAKGSKAISEMKDEIISSYSKKGD